MEPHIVNANPKYPPARLIDPAPAGYLIVAAEIDPPQRPGPRLGENTGKTALLSQVKQLVRQLETLPEVTKATVFDAVAIAPLSDTVKAHADTVHIARYDVVVLIQTISPDVIPQVQQAPDFQALSVALTGSAKDLQIIAARCGKRIADVNDATNGLFLFNFFAGNDQARMLRLWDYMAGWYEVETGLDNSVLMVPLADHQQSADYLAINHAKWNMSLPRFLARQLGKKSFRSYMLANLKANDIGAMPILYRLA